MNTTSVQREVLEVKKKWQDVQSATKKKEAARLKLARATGGGPPAEDASKSWEQVVSFFKFDKMIFYKALAHFN